MGYDSMRVPVDRLKSPFKSDQEMLDFLFDHTTETTNGSSFTRIISTRPKRDRQRPTPDGAKG